MTYDAAETRKLIAQILRDSDACVRDSKQLGVAIDFRWYEVARKIRAAKKSAMLANEGGTICEPKQAAEILHSIQIIKAQLQKHAYCPGNEGEASHGIAL